MEIKDYVLEHTKPLFKQYRFLTVHNLYKLFAFNELFKIQKFHSPISLFTLLHSCSNHNDENNATKLDRKNNLELPNYDLEMSRKQFLFCSIKIYNALNWKVLPPSKLNKKLNIIIPGTDPYSDLSAPKSYVKKKCNEILFNFQHMGNSLNWEKSNFDTILK